MLQTRLSLGPALEGVPLGQFLKWRSVPNHVSPSLRATPQGPPVVVNSPVSQYPEAGWGEASGLLQLSSSGTTLSPGPADGRGRVPLTALPCQGGRAGGRKPAGVGPVGMLSWCSGLSSLYFCGRRGALSSCQGEREAGARFPRPVPTSRSVGARALSPSSTCWGRGPGWLLSPAPRLPG